MCFDCSGYSEIQASCVTLMSLLQTVPLYQILATSFWKLVNTSTSVVMEQKKKNSALPYSAAED